MAKSVLICVLSFFLFLATQPIIFVYGVSASISHYAPCGKYEAYLLLVLRARIHDTGGTMGSHKSSRNDENTKSTKEMGMFAKELHRTAVTLQHLVFLSPKWKTWHLK